MVLFRDRGRVAAMTVSAPPASVQIARRLFLVVVSEIEPQVLQSLRSGPYAVLGESGRAARVLFDWSLVEQVTELGPLRQSLKQWGGRWLLIDRWCLEAALQTISYWHIVPNSQGWFHQGFGAGKADTENLSLDLGRWDSLEQPRKDFEVQTRKLFEFALQQYCEGVEAQAIEAGLSRTPEKRSIDHFYWLARVHVKCEKPADIWRYNAARSGGSRRAVEKAVSDLAKFIGLTLRRGSNSDAL